ncbi:hypothetical protein WNY37_03675 [Henriciella sp. AS95]|uniref:hypothetical protein n=1 Tax=Henriciella sp. AS95 TaxID=3135782 RepID=UPI0031750227
MAITADSTASSRDRTKAKWRRFKVDLWLTDINTVELGIMKHTQHEADSDQFTKDMEVIGQVKEDGERTGILAYRKEAWNESDGMKRRLIIKQFTDSMNWRGSMEFMMGRSLALSIGARGVPVSAYTLNLARHDQLIQLERSAHKWLFMPEYFSFFIETDDGPRFYRLRRKVIAIGADYILYDGRGRKIGVLDHHILNLGGSWHVKLRESAAYIELEVALQMFCAMLRFNHDARNHVKRQLRKVTRGETDLDLDHHEKDLYANPRKLR